MAILRKKLSKDEREKQVLVGLIELFIDQGKPIGSQTLQECGFKHLSSATIRNYFAKLEEEGYLSQQHTSGGRIPTPKAFRLYAEDCLDNQTSDFKGQKLLRQALVKETKEVVNYLQSAVEIISEISSCAAFLSSARFDQDFIADIKLLPIDESRCIAAIITDFGLIRTEILRAEKKLGQFAIKRIEAFFRYKLTGLDLPELSDEELTLAKRFYNEILLRQVASHTNFTKPDILKTGFSRLLQYEDFNDVTLLANALSLFENDATLSKILLDTQRLQNLNLWMEEDLLFNSGEAPVPLCIMTIPYSIHHTVAGAIGILAPLRSPYKTLLPLLQEAADCLTETLTKSVYKFKISFRKPSLHPANPALQAGYEALLIENKS